MTPHRRNLKPTPRYTPGPHADAVADMVRSGVSAFTTAAFFKIGLRECLMIVNWVNAYDEGLHGTPSDTV